MEGLVNLRNANDDDYMLTSTNEIKHWEKIADKLGNKYSRGM